MTIKRLPSSTRPSETYSTTAISLHWLVGLLIVCCFYLGWVMTGIPGATPMKMQYVTWHKWIGVTVFLLAVLRVIWRATHTPPSMPEMPNWQIRMAQFTHFLLYVLMLLIPATGYLFSSAAGRQVVYLGLLTLPTIIAPNEALRTAFRLVHITLNYVLLVLVVTHVLATLKHQFFNRDGLLARMVPVIK